MLSVHFLYILLLLLLFIFSSALYFFFHIFSLFSHLLAGRDTTAMLLTWALYCLMKNPLVLAKLEEEVNFIIYYLLLSLLIIYFILSFFFFLSIRLLAICQSPFLSLFLSLHILCTHTVSHTSCMYKYIS
ncbi:cytochrome P450 [Patescibacteria group bacterium]|nr:cytochrome P450 [Patescibacteria group bacterium]